LIVFVVVRSGCFWCETGAVITSDGGTGARSSKDGLSATAFPTSLSGTPVEIAETQTPLLFWRKELRLIYGMPQATCKTHQPICGARSPRLSRRGMTSRVNRMIPS
jgi:hypothetical protein